MPVYTRCILTDVSFNENDNVHNYYKFKGHIEIHKMCVCVCVRVRV